MGVYINPPSEPKEAFLARYDSISEKAAKGWTDPDKGFLSVCLVQNGIFTAAAVCYKESEWEEFTEADDPRPKMWFLVPVEKLLEVSDLGPWMKRGGKNGN